MNIIDRERGPFITYDREGNIQSSGFGIVTSDTIAGGLKYQRVEAESIWHYVDVESDEVRPRKTFSVPEDLAGVSDDETETVIRVPNGTVCGDVVCEDGTLELTFDTPGEHELVLKHPHYLDMNIVINVKEPPE